MTRTKATKVNGAKLHICAVMISFLALVVSAAAQTATTNSSAISASAQVPPLIPFSSVASDEGGNSLSGVVNITFSLYNAPQGGQPLWSETQNNVQLDSTGHYSVQLGITRPNGVPTTLFTSGEARWLGIQIAEQAAEPRVLLLWRAATVSESEYVFFTLRTQPSTFEASIRLGIMH